ncbi:MAG: hypothetical protein QHH15_05100, partial [Candidatus Thermoplasmatota archaeon]|nr:hypothetical protein [Candidatus Thermoplasmatota archaeon]
MLKEFNLKNLLFSKINRKITFLFLIVGFVSPSLVILYFYNVTISYIPKNVFAEKISTLAIIAILIIILISLNVGVIGFYLSQSISKPIKQLYN